MYRRFLHSIQQNSMKGCLIHSNLKWISVTPQLLHTIGSNTNSRIEDDKADMERERELRAKFAAKIHNVVNESTSNTSSSNTGNEDNNNTSKEMGPFGHFFFFLGTIYLIFVLQQLDNPNSAFSLLQGIPWWQLPVDTLSYFLLTKAILPYRQQFSIKGEFEAESKINPMLTYAQFMDLRYPNSLQGYRTQQREIVTALAACYAISSELKLQDVVRRAAVARDPKQAVDDVMAALYKEYPGVFMAPAPVSPSHQ
eukprot:Tbor_TRINITY_DN1758_c0_g1::TRINITY_DN1758_c0_g1_i1::g.21278::m.21278